MNINENNIDDIRILTHNTAEFETEADFKSYFEETLKKREGKYYRKSSNNIIKKPNTLVLFHYAKEIRAIGVLTESRKYENEKKEEFKDERGKYYGAYYKFNVETLRYLDHPINRDTMRSIYPDFSDFNQATSNISIPIKCLDKLIDAIGGSVLAEKIVNELTNVNCEGREKEAIVKIRVNQNIFREKLLNKYSKCCVCGMENKNFLIASHIKSWADSNSAEKLDINNGFLMCPNHDKLFDTHFISFDDNGSILISSKLNQIDRLLLNVHTDNSISLTAENKKYLEYHRKKFIK